MSTSTAKAQGPGAHEISDGTVMTIGQLASRTGLTPEVLRMWETRHGFPTPVRLPSGHRRYTEEDVTGVLRVLRLREGGLHLEQAIARVRRDDATLTEGSVYAALRHRFPELPSYTLEKQTLLALSWAIEDESVALARRPLLIGSFQAGRYFEASAARWRELSRVARSSYVLADFASTDDDLSPRQVALPPDSPMLREWIVVCDGDGLTAALAAWEVPGQPPGAARLFEAVWSLEPEVVRAASQTALAISVEAGSADAGAELADLDTRPLPAPTSQRVATALFNRMVAYTDGTVLRARRR